MTKIRFTPVLVSYPKTGTAFPEMCVLLLLCLWIRTLRNLATLPRTITVISNFVMLEWDTTEAIVFSCFSPPLSSGSIKRLAYDCYAQRHSPTVRSFWGRFGASLQCAVQRERSSVCNGGKGTSIPYSGHFSSGEWFWCFGGKEGVAGKLKRKGRAG